MPPPRVRAPEYPELRQHLLSVLEDHTSFCLDNDHERELLAHMLARAVAELLMDRCLEE